MRNNLQKAASTLAHLYVFDVITTILEGSPTPDREDDIAARQVKKILDICSKEKVRLLRKFDKALLGATTPQPGAEAMRELVQRAIPFLRDEGANYADDGSNEPLELAREMESLLARGG